MTSDIVDRGSATFIRRLIATACAFTAAAFMRSWNGDNLPWVLWLPTGMLVAAGVMVHRPFLGGQLLARAVFWANLLLGTVIATSAVGADHFVATGLALTCGAALLVVGRTGLAPGQSAFRPVAFRATLITALVMAMADAQSLALWGGVGMEEEYARVSQAPYLLACAGVMILAIIGLYRMKLWGLVLNVAANIAIAAIALSGHLDLPTPIVYMLATTAVIQTLLPLPLIVAFFSTKPPRQRAGHLGTVLAAATVAGLMLVSVACYVLDVQLLRF